MADPLALTIVVMAYNEAGNLAQVVAGLSETGAAATPDYEILIVDDGSTDDTGSIADDIAASDERVRVVHHRPNAGLGGVYRTGFRESQGEFVTFFPADDQFPAEIVTDFFPRMRDQDIVLGYLPDRPSPWIAQALSGLERVLYVLLFGGFPKFQGILMLRRSLTEKYPLVSTGRGWVVLYELILRAKKDGARITSVPTDARPRAQGRSKVTNVGTAWANFKEVLRLRLKF